MVFGGDVHRLWAAITADKVDIYAGQYKVCDLIFRVAVKKKQVIKIRSAINCLYLIKILLLTNKRRF